MKLHITTLLYIVLLANTAQNIGMDGSFTTNNGIPIAPMTLTLPDTTTKPIQLAEPLEDAVVQLAYRHAPTRIQRFIDDLEDYPETIPTKRQYLFTGKPGSGKTTLAQAVAQKAGWSCVLVPIPEFCNEYRNSEAGALTSYINATLNQHRKCVIVLDEMTLLTDSHNKEQNDGDSKAATTLWWLLDKCKKRNDIVVIGTTNDDSKLPAPLKSRLNNNGIVTISSPALEVRVELLNHLFTNLGLTLDEAYLNEIAKRAHDKSFRDIIDFSEQVADHAIDRQYAIEQENTGLTVDADNNRDITQEDIDAIMATWRAWYHPSELRGKYGTSVRDGLIKSLPIAIPATLTIAGLTFTVYQFIKNQDAANKQMRFSLEQAQKATEHATEQLWIAREQLTMQKEAVAKQEKEKADDNSAIAWVKWAGYGVGRIALTVGTQAAYIWLTKEPKKE